MQNGNQENNWNGEEYILQYEIYPIIKGHKSYTQKKDIEDVRIIYSTRIILNGKDPGTYNKNKE